jgi:hypothetical protein
VAAVVAGAGRGRDRCGVCGLGAVRAIGELLNLPVIVALYSVS